MAMALGLGLASPVAAALPDHGRLRCITSRRRRDLVVRSLREDDAEITSMRDQTLNTFAKRVFDWGRGFHQQAIDQMQKLFHELADGSILISFGATASTKTAEVKVPPRLPSRYSKQFPYPAKRTKTRTSSEPAAETKIVRPVSDRTPSTFAKKSPITKGSERHAAGRILVDGEEAGIATLELNDVQLEAQQSQELPDRVPSAFSKKSPITRSSRRHAIKRISVDSSADEVGITTLEDVHLAAESDTVSEREEVKPVKKLPHRVLSTFSKKSPITKCSGRRHRNQLPAGDIVQESEFEKIADEQVHTESLSKLVLRPATAFTRKLPIPQGGGRTRKAVTTLTKEIGTTVEANKDAAADEEAVLSSGSTRSRISRPVAAFSRKSPITRGKDGKRKRRTSRASVAVTETSVSANDAENAKALFAASSIPETERSMKSLRPKATFVRKSPISSTHSRSSRKKRQQSASDQAAEVPGRGSKVSEEEIVRLVLEAADAVGTKERNPAAPSVKVDEENMLSSEEGLATSGSKNRRRTLRVEVSETDVEVSDDDDDESASNIAATMDETDLSIMTLQRLKSIAKSKGLKGYSRLRKAELVELLKQS